MNKKITGQFNMFRRNYIKELDNVFKTKIIGKTTFTTLKSLLRHQNLPEIGWLILGQVISIVLGFVSMKLLTSMGTKEFGKYSLVLTIAALVSSIFYGPAEQGFVRFYYEYANKGRARTFISIFYKFLLIAGFSFLTITIIAIPVNYYLETSEHTLGILIMGLYIITFTSSNIYNSILNLLRKRKTNTILQLSERTLIIVFLFIMTLNTKLTASTGLLAILVALIIVLILKTKVLNTYVPADIITNNHEQKESHKKITTVIATFGLPFAIWGATGWLQSNSERWVIAQYLSTADVGIFSLMSVLASYLVSIPSGLIGQFAQPIIYEKTSNIDNLNKIAEGKKALNYFVYTIIALVFLSTISSIIFGQQLIFLASNKEFCTYWHILPILCIGIGVFQIGQALTTVGIIQNVPKKYLFPKIVTGIFAVLSNIFFISQLGIVGIAVSICLTSSIYLMFIILINHRIKLVTN